MISLLIHQFKSKALIERVLPRKFLKSLRSENLKGKVLIIPVRVTSLSVTGNFSLITLVMNSPKWYDKNESLYK